MRVWPIRPIWTVLVWSGALTGLAGCIPPKDPFAPGSVPRLPAPLGEIYTDALAAPQDPLVRRLAAGLPWDEVLSGAAGGVALSALQGEPINGYRVRWKAVLAGWMSPVLGIATQKVGFDEIPETLIAQAREQGKIRAGSGDRRIGLARARSMSGDQWVLLVSDAADIGPVLREPPQGGSVEFLGARFWLSAPDGGVYEDVSGAHRFPQAGEWLVEARDAAGGTVARFPLFVGEDTPMLPPIAGEREGPPEEAALGLLQEIRAWYGLGPLRRDPTMDSVARARLRVWNDGGAPPEPAQSLRAAGFFETETAGLQCEAGSVAACLDGRWWSLDDHAAFSGPWRSVGLAVEPGPTLRLMVVLAG